MILLSPGKVKWYLGERCYRQIARTKGFVVLSPPPWVIETEGALGKGEIGEPINANLVPNMDYAKWLTTQTYRPLAGPVEGEVCS